MQRQFIITASSFALAAAVSAAAIAQQGEDATSENARSDEARVTDVITVTAQLRTQPLQEVPLPINAFTGEFLEQLRVDGFADLADLSPGLEVLEQTVQNPNFVVRGVSSGGSAANIENRISIFQDGVSINRAQGALVELFDIAQVEILKGPQGTLYGRGSTAGAISVTSARPDFGGVYGSALLGVEDFNGRRAEIVANAPVNDRIALRGAVTHHYREGFIDNQENDEPTAGKDMTAFRVSATARLTETAEATLILNGQRDRSNSNVFKAITIPTPGSGFASTGDNAPWNPFENRTDPFAPMASDLADESYIRRDIAGATLLADVDLGDVTLDWISSYRYLKSDDLFDVDGSYLFIINGLEDTRLDQYTTELRASYDTGGRWSAVAGASLFHEATDYRIWLQYDPNRVLSLVLPTSPFLRQPVDADGMANPALPLGFPDVVVEEGLTESVTTSYSVYADATFAATDRLNVSAGVRYTFDDKELTTTRPLSNTGIFIPTSTGDARDRSTDFDAFQPRLVVDYSWTEEVMTYAGVTTGYRSGVIPEAGVSNDDPVVDPEYVTSYEIGARTTSFDGRLRMNGSVFYYDWTDFQTQIIDPDTNLAIPAAAGEASALGFELEGDLRINDTVSLFGNLNLIDAEYDSFVSGEQDLSGNTLTRSPRTRFTLGANVERVLPDSWTVRANGYVSYRSKQYFSNENTALESQGAYTLVNGALSLISPTGRYGVTAYAENLFNTEYLGDAGNTGRSFGFPTWVPGQPRVIGLEVTAKF
ncbi:MAG: TonB-dependent receptor [Verrucomicrobiota bacterium]